MEQLTREQALYRRIGHRAGWAILALVGLTSGIQLLANWWIGTTMPHLREIPVWLMWFLTFVPLYCVAVPVFTVLLQPLPGIRPSGQKLRAGWMIGTMCAAMTLMYAGSLVGNLLNWGIGWLRGEPVLSGLNTLVSMAPVWQTLLFACVLAPVGEELIFSYLLEKTLVFGEKRAALYCALAFGLFHGNLYQFFYAFLLRLLLVRVRLHTGRVIWCIMLHAFVNVVGSVISVWAVGQSQWVMAVYGVVLLALVCAGAAVLVMRRGTVARALPRPQAQASWLFANPGAILAWMCSAVLFVLMLL